MRKWNAPRVVAGLYTRPTFPCGLSSFMSLNNSKPPRRNGAVAAPAPVSRETLNIVKRDTDGQRHKGHEIA